MVIGVIGGVGVGKSTVLEALERDYGFRILKADDVAKRLYVPETEVGEGLRRIFGEQVFQPGGQLNTSLVAEGIYRDPELRKRLEELVHPAAWSRIYEAIRETREAEKRREKLSERAVSMETETSAEMSAEEALTALCVETALPTEGFAASCDEVWFVRADREVRIRRLMKSRGYSRERSESIIGAQPSDEAYQRLATFVIDNSGTKEETLDEIYQHCKRFKR